MLKIKKRLSSNKAYWYGAAGILICVFVVTSLNMQTVLHPDRLSSILPFSTTAKTDDHQQLSESAAQTEAIGDTRATNSQTKASSSDNNTSPPSTSNTSLTPSDSPSVSPEPSPNPNPTPSPEPTQGPDPLPKPTDEPITE